VSGQIHFPVALIPGERTSDFIEWGLFEPHDQSGRFWKRQKSLTVPGIRTPNHAAIPYTRDAISAIIYKFNL